MHTLTQRDDGNQDLDVAAIAVALRRRLDVRHPLDSRRTLVPRRKDEARLVRFRELLEYTLQPLTGRARPGVRAWAKALGVRL